RFVTTPEQQERITSQFIQASNSGDMQGLLKLLSDDIVFTGDSGGKVRIGHRVRGRNKVARGSVAGLRAFPPTMQVRAELVNGQRALVGYVDNQPCGVVFLDIEGEYIRSIYVVANPDKLHWLSSASH
ncbi:MAG TPA: RNA polymerase sigma-70 factor, partial [Ktedonobacteraceae bacterium]|nr:RNA polymerase sigma-70 factor [Ktedonobacteraceae bacterium]